LHPDRDETGRQSKKQLSKKENTKTKTLKGLVAKREARKFPRGPSKQLGLEGGSETCKPRKKEKCPIVGKTARGKEAP